MKITKKFIKENQDKTLKELFPDVFKVELEVGKWYKTTHKRGKCLFCFTGDFDEDNYPLGYGFDSDNKFHISYSNSGWGFEKCNPRIATPKEVQQALEKEAVNRGFEEGVYFTDINNDTFLLTKDFGKKYHFENNRLYLYGWEIFNNGQWATVKQPITKQEAEEKLKCKIV